MSKKLKFITILSLFLMTGCNSNDAAIEPNNEVSLEITDTTETEETISTEPVWEPTQEDKEIALWFKNYITDPEELTDIADYQYYARAIGQDKDYFLDADMWEVYYNAESINRNREINGLDIYLVRLNPYKLLDVYAENNNCSVDELCKQLSVSKEQLYYNWGYTTASEDYYNGHKNNEVTYSIQEQEIFGIFNNEERNICMDTHMIVYDHNEGLILYKSELYEELKIARRDNLKAYSNALLYSEFTDAEKEPAFKVNGIGIRAVIPLTLPNAFAYAEGDDKNISVMINRSPFSYGCTDADRLDLDAIYKYIEEET